MSSTSSTRGPGRPTNIERAQRARAIEQERIDAEFGREIRRRGPENRGRGRAPMTPAQRARGQDDRTEKRTRSEYRPIVEPRVAPRVEPRDTGFLGMASASRDLDFALGMDRKVDIIGPDADGALGPIWNQLNDTTSEQLQLLKSVYGVASREELIAKIQEQMGLRKKTVHPLQLYRQASFIHDLTENHYPCDWSRNVFPAVGNKKSYL